MRPAWKGGICQPPALSPFNPSDLRLILRETLLTPETEQATALKLPTRVLITYKDLSSNGKQPFQKKMLAIVQCINSEVANIVSVDM